MPDISVEDIKQNPLESLPPTDTKELETKFMQAAGVGKASLTINKDRESGGFSFWFDQDRLPRNLIEAMTDKATGTVITQEDVNRAEEGSFGITLGFVHQMSERTEKQTGRMVDDTDSLEGLLSCLSDGERVGKTILAASSDRYLNTAKQVIGVELGIKPEDVSMTPEQIKKWIEDSYSGGLGRLNRKRELLEEYFGRN